jgi:hypothetical protein
MRSDLPTGTGAEGYAVERGREAGRRLSLAQAVALGEVEP